MAEDNELPEILTYWERKGYEQGFKRGYKLGLLPRAIRHLELRFGEVPAEDRKTLEHLEFADFERVALAVTDVHSYEEWQSLLRAAQNAH